MIAFTRIDELVTLAEAKKTGIADIVLEWEVEKSEVPANRVWDNMRGRLAVMQQAVDGGLKQREKSFSGLVGGDACKLLMPAAFLGPVATQAAAYAMAVGEVNASMGKIVACPTAGSCGIVPGAILAVAGLITNREEKLVKALFTAAGIGEVIAKNATVAGAVGGCQAECGSAAAMAAAAVVEMLEGTPRQSAHALALALKNMLGLVCDPVAGLVEVPCVKRNAFAAVHALVAAQMALAGIESVIPADEVIDAMFRIGIDLPSSLKETSEGGLAKTPTALAITRRLLQAE
ncbi:putative L-serine dehydratase, alpha chain [Propionispora sp. 2/2-37]|uniref:L-serine ammonia-lyase, iron-sulfur-dependent, subunit alpha n=1 Tax=Propionispora sp. 2/2-37 TaxID=1677858 RepID=UPI0006BB99CD|nr:L-serine ammonia-lyase, iron-sulfur-dependent, subunit alpha [Propionispora sp. 2/2-37]CUH97809.1 putative L-serine dehydratase, alpha chain [Propionispora sp. 2/2-37]